MSNRKNSFEKINKENNNNSDTRNDSKDSRTWSIGSIGSMDTIILDEEDMVDKNIKPRRRSRDKNINTRRNSPNPIYWKSLLDEFLKKKNKAQK